MDKISKLGFFVSEAGKNAKVFLDKSKDAAVKVIDQNDDGKIDFSDVSEIAGTVGSAVKRKTHEIKESAEEKAKEIELKLLSPLFEADIKSISFQLPKFIHVCERDKRHADSELCKGSIGYTSIHEGLRLVHLFRDSLSSFRISFYPDNRSDFYYIDPVDEQLYIAIEDYFSYLKLVRINELQKLAQDLGAKYFKVVYKEESLSSSQKKLTLNGALPEVKLNGEHSVTQEKFSAVEIAAEMHCPGHEPQKPHLHYLEKDPSIQALIAMRMDISSPLSHQVFTLKMSNSSGIKENDAVKIDGVLKGMKYNVQTNMQTESSKEAKRYLDYEVDF